MRRDGLLLAAGGYLCWGLLSPGNAILLRELDPLWMQASRSIVAIAVLAVWLKPRGLVAGAKILRNPAILTALFFGTVASFTLFSYAQTRLGPAEATLGFFAAPLWTALFGWWLLKERVGKRFAAAVAVMLTGAYFALDPGDSGDGIGILLAVGSGLTWGLYAVLLRQAAPDTPWRHLLAASILLATPIFTVGAFLFEDAPNWLALSGETYLWTAIQVAIPTILAIALFQAALQTTSAATVNMFVGLELVGAFVWSYVLIHETYTPMQVAGAGVVLVAITTYLVSKSRDN